MNPDLQTDDQSARDRRAAFSQARRRFAKTLMIGGVTCWVGLMSYIVYLDLNRVRVGYGALVAVTILCWLTFFAGKTILKYSSESERREDHGR